MNYERIYQYRFRDVQQEARQRVWNEIGSFIYDDIGRPERILEPAAGRCEFINSVPSPERWIVDRVNYSEGIRQPDIRMIEGDVLTAELPENYFDAIFVSNFLEHLSSQAEVAQFLGRMHRCLKPGGRMGILGPNFKYCAKDYFDCADHTLALTHVAVEEHLYAAGFEVTKVVPRFLPYSFRGLLPPSGTLTRAYLRFPPAWRVLGKQFYLQGRKEER